MHPETYALAWETIPRSEKPALLLKANCAVPYVQACADARWSSLPPLVTSGLKPLLDERVVSSCDAELRRREQEQ